MFNFQGSEIIIILLLALVVLGPEKLPDAMRKAGKAYSELKKMSSGFQSEFRAAVDEPLREIRDTANVLRDSADFTRLQDGSRVEKPRSAEMAAVDPGPDPSDDVPTFETPAHQPDGPAVAPDSDPAPFEVDRASHDPTSVEAATDAGSTDSGSTDAASCDDTRRALPGRTPIRAPAPFTGMSSAAPRPAGDDRAIGEPERARRDPFNGSSSAAPRPKVDESPPTAEPATAADGPVSAGAPEAVHPARVSDEPPPAEQQTAPADDDR